MPNEKRVIASAADGMTPDSRRAMSSCSLFQVHGADARGVCGLLMQLGEAMPQGIAGLRRELPQRLDLLPALLQPLLPEAYERFIELQRQLDVHTGARNRSCRLNRCADA